MGEIYRNAHYNKQLLKKKKLIGLTDDEVKERIKNGETNKIPKSPSRTFLNIIRANFFNIFSGINITLASLVLIAGSPKNAVFALVIIVNNIIGVTQELNAKKTLEKLSVLSMVNGKVLRSGKIIDIKVEDIVKDDIVYLSTGQQVLSDCRVIMCDEIEVDESMLTGESDSVYKSNEDILLSGSFIVAGEGYARVIKVGSDTYTSKLADEAKRFKVINSELQRSINKVIKALLWAIVPIGIVLTITQLLYTNTDWKGAIIGTVSGVSGMIPEGLILLTSTTFIVSIVNLSKHNTLVQQLSATENLARIDVLCLDKTGTITEGRLELLDILSLGDNKREEIDLAISSIVYNLPSKNSTQEAILEFYTKDPKVNVMKKIPFSSRRKWGGITVQGKGSWIMGAPEIILRDRYEDIKDKVELHAREGKRVLLLGKVEDEGFNENLEFTVKEMGLILLNDVIRKEAPRVIKEFREEGVEIKVISGDNPVTVSNLAKRAGIYGAENYIDGRDLNDKEDLTKIVDDYTVFGRVTPHQKRDLVKALQKGGKTVGMTGDGVNDILALKESDCSIAMANGSDATKAVAQLVLLDSNFSSLTSVVAEGRKQIHNLEVVAQLFLSKTVFYVIMAIVFCIIRLPYPIIPIQASLIGSCAIGLPALLLTMLPYKGKIEGNFLGRVLSESIPNGIVMVLFTTISYIAAYMNNKSIEHCRTLAIFTLMGISFMILFKVSSPLNKIKSTLIIIMGALAFLCSSLPLGKMIFSLTTINLFELGMVMGFVLLSYPIMKFSSKIISAIKKEREIKKKNLIYEVDNK